MELDYRGSELEQSPQKQSFTWVCVKSCVSPHGSHVRRRCLALPATQLTWWLRSLLCSGLQFCQIFRLVRHVTSFAFLSLFFWESCVLVYLFTSDWLKQNHRNGRPTQGFQKFRQNVQFVFTDNFFEQTRLTKTPNDKLCFRFSHSLIIRIIA